MDNIIQFLGKISEEGLKVNILSDEFLCYVYANDFVNAKGQAIQKLFSHGTPSLPQ